MAPRRLRSLPPDDGADGDLGLSFASDDDLFRDTTRGHPSEELGSKDHVQPNGQNSSRAKTGNAAQSELEQLLNTSSISKAFDANNTASTDGGSRFMDDLAQRRNGSGNDLLHARASKSGSNTFAGRTGRSIRVSNNVTPKTLPSRTQYPSMSTSSPNSPYLSNPDQMGSPSPLIRRSSSQKEHQQSGGHHYSTPRPGSGLGLGYTSSSSNGHGHNPSPRSTEEAERANLARSRTMPRGRKSSSRTGERVGMNDRSGGVQGDEGGDMEDSGFAQMGNGTKKVEDQSSDKGASITPNRPSHQPNIHIDPSSTTSTPTSNSITPPTFLPTQIALPLSRYISDLLICNFHLDLGPIVERRLAGRAWSTKGEKANVAFSSFPDRGVVGEGSVGFGFKIRRGEEGGLRLDENARRREGRVEDEEEVGGAAETPRARRMGKEPESYFGMTPISAEPETMDRSQIPSTQIGQQISTPSSPRPQSSRDPPAPHTPQPIHSPSFFGPPPEPPTPSHLQPPPPTTLERFTEYQHWDSHGRAWLYGFVWFQQRKDPTIARGYMQRSLVVLTHLPWPGLFARVLEVVAPRYFGLGYGALEAACREMARWPDPIPGAVLRLPLCGEILHVRLPDATEASQIPQGLPGVSVNGLGSTHGSETLPTLPSTTPLRTFATLLPSLWHLWECMMLSEPIMVIASDPKLCSEAVWWLRDLLRPIPAIMYDFRPYFHIHDADFGLLVNSDKPQPGVVIGVTNPVFRTAAGHWSNIISLGGEKMQSRGQKSSTGPSGFVPEPEGFISKRKRHVSKDRDLLKRLEGLVSAQKSDDPSGNEALRTHFMQMTEKMLAPVNRYIASLIPPPGSAEPMRPFSLTAFLAHLKSNAPNPLQFRTRGMSSKSKSESDFYTAFCTGVGFTGWLLDKVHDLNSSRTAAGMPILEPPRLHLQGSNPPRTLGGNSLDYPRSSTDTEQSVDGGRSSMSSRPSPKDVHFAGRRKSEGAVLGMDSMRLS